VQALKRSAGQIYGAEPAARARAVRLNATEIGLSMREIASVMASGSWLPSANARDLSAISRCARTRRYPISVILPASAFVDQKREQVASQQWIRTLRVKTTGPEQEIRLLSGGGNQQKVCLARWLLGKPSFLILEEPTRGVDLEGAARNL